MNELYLSTHNIVKRFGDVVAVNEVNLNVYRGQIQGLIGENGSGKSTISQMISGIYSITSGTITLEGKPYLPKSVSDATLNKIAMIVQETGTIDTLSIAENLFLGQEKKFTKYGVLNKKKMESEAKALLEPVHLENVDVTIPIMSYSFEVRKLVEIAKALSIDPELFIVDETTTALSHDGRLLIHEIMRDLRNKNKAVLFISHDLEELMETCDCLTVLRDGKLVSTFEKEEFEENKIKNTMVGRVIEGDYYRSDYDPSHGERVTLEVRNIETADLHDVSLEVHEGEILGIGGLSGSGMHELGKAIFGMEKLKSGEIIANAPRQLKFSERMKKYKAKLFKKEFDIELENTSYNIKSIDTALKASIGYISKDRDKETLILQADIKDNLVLSDLDNLKVFGLISPLDEKKFAKEMIGEYRIKCSGMHQLVKELSGGNKQKISFAKWIGNNSKILVFDSPTRGVDIGVKTTMYQILTDLKHKGYTIVIISEEMPELLGMSDRIVIFKDGRITKEFLRDKNLKDTDVISYMI